MKNERQTHATASGSGPCSDGWELLADEEHRIAFRWNRCTVTLRVLLGGNGRRTPVVEIIADKPRVTIGPRGGKRMPSRYVGGDVLPQRDTVDDAKRDLEEWWCDYLYQNDNNPPTA